MLKVEIGQKVRIKHSGRIVTINSDTFPDWLDGRRKAVEVLTEDGLPDVFRVSQLEAT